MTADTERSAATGSNIVSSTAVANGAPAVTPSAASSQSHHAIIPQHVRGAAKNPRPRSQLEPLKASSTGAVKRSASIRLEDISSPRLQSSTNNSVSSASGTDDTASAGKLQPTRAAPAPPVDQLTHKPPQRPPPPCPTINSRDSAVTSSPSGPPPAPPDSRHRFYSTQLPRRPTDNLVPSSTTPPSVASMRSRFEASSPVPRAASPGSNQMLRQTRRAGAVSPGISSCSSVAAAVVPAAKRPPPPRTSPAPINESQC